MNTLTGPDITPLSWVKAEIDQELSRALAALRAFFADPSDQTQLQSGQAHFHQIHGALQVVGLDGLSRFSEELEGFLLDLRAVPFTAEALALLERSFAGLSAYLKQLLEGQPDQPLRLYRLYADLVNARGKAEPDPVDLYFPDLKPAAVPPAPAAGGVPQDRVRVLRDAHARYQRGLLGWLRGRDEAGAGDIEAALAAVAGAEGTAESHAFWWAARALARALVRGELADDPGMERIWPRIERQISRLLKGTASVSDRMFREVLFLIARSPASAEALHEVRAAFNLEGTVPETFDLAGDDTQDLPRIDALKDLVQSAKTAWMRYATGHTPTVTPFTEWAVQLRDSCAKLKRWDLARLAEEMLTAADLFTGTEGPIDEHIAVEIATALLVLEDSLQGGLGTARELGQQCQALADRLKRWRESGQRGLARGEPALEGVTRRAQERMAVSQIVAEVRKTLRTVEHLLDAFFRDPEKRTGLGEVRPLLAQVCGAFGVLGEQRSADIINECIGIVDRCIAGADPLETADYEYLAGLLSAIGFHAEALQSGSSELERALRRLQRPAGDVPAPAVAAPVPATVESELRERQLESLAQVQALQNAPGDAQRKQQLRETLEEIRSDASITADLELERRAGEALNLLELDAASAAELIGAVRSMPSLPEPAPAPSPEVEALAEAPAEVIDAELLGTYLEEASQILAELDRHRQVLETQPASAEALQAIRRAFHTLKGSGRMVGLMALAETAYAVEKVLNRFLDARAPGNPRLSELVGLTAAHFAEVLAALRAGRPLPGAGAVLAACARVEPEAAPAAAARPPEGLQEIFLAEARTLLEALRTASDGLVTGGEISEDFHRAAHTLAGISGTAGAPVMRELALALEHALESCGSPPPVPVRMVLSAAVDALAGMLQSISRGAAPRPALELIERLAALGAAEPPGGVAFAPPGGVAAEALAGRAAEPGAPPSPEVQAALAGLSGADAELIEVFLNEAEELLPRIGVALRDWSGDVQEKNHARELRRALHTLKGSARTAGAEQIGQLLHEMETAVEGALGLAIAPESVLVHLEQQYDQVSTLFDTLRSVLSARTPERPGRAAIAVAQPFNLAQDLSPAPAPHPAQAMTQAAPAKEAPEVAREAEAEAAARPEPDRGAMLRVRAETVDRLVGAVGELAIARGHVERQLKTLRTSLIDLTENAARLRHQLREMEIQAESRIQARLVQREGNLFDPLEFDRFTGFQELTRLMAESVGDILTVHGTISRALEEADSELLAQQRLTRDLQQDLLKVRMVPFGSIGERLHRAARQAAQETGRMVAVEIRNGQVELDRSILERLSGPLEHVIRNAVFHGIEPPALRVAAGKPETGHIVLEVATEGNQIALSVADDGAGIDPEQIRRRAVELGLIGGEDPYGAADLLALVFVPGFSTAAQVTPLAGRGVGLDVVRSEIAEIGGRVDVSSQPGRGTRFEFSLPLTLLVTQAVLVSAGGARYLVPASMIEEIRPVLPAELRMFRDAGTAVSASGARVPFAYLPNLLGESRAPAAGGDQGTGRGAEKAPVIFVRGGTRGAAILVDALEGNQEIVVKNTGPLIARIAGITGATILNSGEIVLILNPFLLMQRAPLAEPRPAPRPRPVVRDLQPLVLVVDDSLTVRRASERLLSREGYKVVTARDGMEAMEMLQSCTPAAILLDIEMPRMDGFGVVRAVRADPRWHSIPIIMITSRTAEKHRQLAFDLGVNVFLGKPYRDDELIHHLRTLVKPGAQPAADDAGSGPAPGRPH